MPDKRLVKKGRSEPLDGLLQQGRASHQLATTHAAALTADGSWSAEDTVGLKTALDTLQTSTATKADAHEQKLGFTDAEEAAIDEVKAFIRRLRNALPRVIRENPAAGVTIESFEAGGRLGRSTPKLSKYLGTIRPSLVRLDAALARHFKGTNPSTLLDTLKTNLDTADAIQEAALEALPTETQTVYEAKGRLLEMIEDLNRAGKSAFDGDAATAAAFNKDLLLRARAARRKKPTETDTDPVAT